MPLVTICGLPSSGKTTRAVELKRRLEERLSQEGRRKLSVQIVGDESLGVARTAYASANEEKMARGALLSAVERLVSREVIVIADSLNYIKSVRYQLHLIAREVSTTHCVVHCAIPVDVARGINQGRADGYPAQVFDELAMRFEEPNPATRWDSPLFTLIQHDPDDQLPFDAIWDAIIERRAPPPNTATAMKPVAETNYLYELDRATQAVVAAVMDAQKSGIPMSHVPVPGAHAQVSLPGRSLSLAELRRHRLQFTKLNRQVPIPVDKIASAFVDYLNAIAFS
ncbi:kti12, chromatin associated [Coemansia sp. RSA 552]|nr:kti12, chromatin associated [Coemansia sp. RSA 552]